MSGSADHAAAAPHGSPADHEHRLPEVDFPVDRLAFLADLCRGRRVLHVGCADDTAIEEKLAAGRHLHGRLGTVAEVVGLDLAAGRLADLSRLGLERLVAGDASVPPFRAGAFDDVVLGEILEHLPDPGAVLRSLRCAGLASRLIVTVPNAYSLFLAGQLRHGVELVNPDHLYTFTPVTLGNLLSRNGWELKRIQPYAWTVPTTPWQSLGGAARRLLRLPGAGQARPAALLRQARAWRAYRRQPFLGDGLIAVAE